MKIYELINTIDEDAHERYFFLHLKMAQTFQKANPEFSIFTRETLDEMFTEDEDCHYREGFDACLQLVLMVLGEKQEYDLKELILEEAELYRKDD